MAFNLGRHGVDLGGEKGKREMSAAQKGWRGSRGETNFSKTSPKSAGYPYPRRGERYTKYNGWPEHRHQMPENRKSCMANAPIRRWIFGDAWTSTPGTSSTGRWSNLMPMPLPRTSKARHPALNFCLLWSTMFTRIQLSVVTA